MLYIRSSEHLFYNWEFVPFNQHLSISPTLATTILFSISILLPHISIITQFLSFGILYILLVNSGLLYDLYNFA